MCGICGIVSCDPNERFDLGLIRPMRDTLSHRGPDDRGEYVGAGVALGHSRHAFQSWTDTEVIVHLYEEFGVDCLARLRGMFAFAIYDSRKRLLFMARDRIGKKPLYYHYDGRHLRFGSEPKAILACPEIHAEPDYKAIDCYLSLGYVPSPLSAFRGIAKLPPGHYLVFTGTEPEVRRYWQINYGPKLAISEQDACEEIVRRLTEAVKLRMISDVPLGAFLSGGVDSSAIVALMSQLSSRPVKTFSIGFDEPDFDETHYARLVSRAFGTEHHELIVRPDGMEALDKLIWHYNEPFADASALPTYYLCKFAREHVTVALNGEAGDENFAGYTRYAESRFLSYPSLLPPRLRAALGWMAEKTGEMLSGGRDTWRRLQLLGGALKGDPRLLYAVWMMNFDRLRKRSLYTPEFMARVAPVPTEEILLELFRRSGTNDLLDSTLYVDVNLYLPEAPLTKVDRASMAVSLEARSPMVDHEFMEFAARLPSRFKLRRNVGKFILKKAFADLLPPEVINRRKMGFGVPLVHWFRGVTKDFMTDILSSSRFLQRGYFEPSYVRNMLTEHQRGQRNWQGGLWIMLNLELWHRAFIDSVLPAARCSKPEAAVASA